jgi:hypothetical protein
MLNRKSREFEPLVKMIKWAKENSSHAGTPLSRETHCDIINEQFNISIGEFNRLMPESSSYTPVDFGDEKNYMMFLLRWL